MSFRILLLVALFPCALSTAHAQTQPTRTQNSNDSISADKASSDSKSRPIGTPEEEMLARQGLKAAEKDYQENVERAREAAQLSAEVRDSFQQNKALGRTELKKLERLEKITRKIRNGAGGSDSEVTIENPPTQIEPAIARLAEMVEKLRKGVEKTPRQVISAPVIENANEVLELLRLIRGFAN